MVSTNFKPRGTLPTFFIIGAPKTGTTSLHYYLELHPGIQMSAVKEPSFFAPAPDDLHVKRGISRLDKYEQLFDPAARVRGEASTNYAEYPFRQGVPERIGELVPEAKFIYVVRDPIDRTVSHYHHLVANGGERRSLEETCGDLADPRTPCICASLYGLQLELYLRRFSEQRMFVIDQADLLTSRRATLREIFAFLGVDDTFDSPRFDVEFLKGSEHRTYPPRLARFVGHTVRPHSWWLPPRVRGLLRRYAESMFLPRLEVSELDSNLRGRLEEFYAHDMARLRALTGKALPTWSV
jgi:Sulfotransferase domain